ncbi:LPXTG cell wall anchor domain-containing protein [Leucobacter chromiiresistens]|uniref:LPXTG-motif cell wall anchor domain-containing protein n=1 Tax=Leucobacter chromiiresistens TaxID=1079994 RepID=A0A1H1BD93_9MICO|nr:LPXTG cell wall anchor domain-containing protein [Leucobacter chromiiresistens]SDQ49934.1 LPXTG-motif cell wall anchor domain-containing protein [Leucobacter chromiiresistens]
MQKSQAFVMKTTLVGIVGASLMTGSSASAIEPADLIEGDEPEVLIESPAPGHLQQWDMSVKNVSGAVLPLEMQIDGESEQLFGGAAPLRVTLAETETGAVLASGAASELLAADVQLPSLGPGDTYRLTGTVALPIEAGNEYQGASGSLDFRFVAVSDDPVASAKSVGAVSQAKEDLAKTGDDGTLSALMAGAIAALVAGGALLARRFRHAGHATAVTSKETSR